MITIYRKNETSTNGNEREIELRGLSTDSKPTSFDGRAIENGTVFIEIDTGKMYLFDKQNQQWKEL